MEQEQIKNLIELAEELKSQWGEYMADVVSLADEDDDGNKLDNPEWDYFDEKEKELYTLKKQLLGD